jgi:hypothetical protein
MSMAHIALGLNTEQSMAAGPLAVGDTFLYFRSNTLSAVVYGY